MITYHCIILSLLVEKSPINRTTGINQSIVRCSIFTDIPVIYITRTYMDDIMSGITTDSQTNNQNEYNIFFHKMIIFAA